MGHEGYDQPHPNSILGRARIEGDTETAQKIKQGRRQEAEDLRRMEQWAKKETGEGSLGTGEKRSGPDTGNNNGILDNGVRALEELSE